MMHERLFLLSAHDALNTGLAKVGFHYGVEEEVTPQFGVREPWQVRVVGHFETREPMRHRS
ncbi:MAG: hypothetical protein HW376_758 [candidate division NC10 bacterium]|nr:hypothetical protein [candidate division NC10 bacterium]